MAFDIDHQDAQQLLYAQYTDSPTSTRLYDRDGFQIARNKAHVDMASQACRLLGCNVVLVGIGVEIAQTLVQLGVDLRSLVTPANLQAGIAWAFARLNLHVVLNVRA